MADGESGDSALSSPRESDEATFAEARAEIKAEEAAAFEIANIEDDTLEGKIALLRQRAAIAKANGAPSLRSPRHEESAATPALALSKPLKRRPTSKRVDRIVDAIVEESSLPSLPRQSPREAAREASKPWREAPAKAKPRRETSAAASRTSDDSSTLPPEETPEEAAAREERRRAALTRLRKANADKAAADQASQNALMARLEEKRKEHEGQKAAEKAMRAERDARWAAAEKARRENAVSRVKGEAEAKARAEARERARREARAGDEAEARRALASAEEDRAYIAEQARLAALARVAQAQREAKGRNQREAERERHEADRRALVLRCGVSAARSRPADGLRGGAGGGAAGGERARREAAREEAVYRQALERVNSGMPAAASKVAAELRAAAPAPPAAEENAPPRDPPTEGGVLPMLARARRSASNGDGWAQDSALDGLMRTALQPLDNGPIYGPNKGARSVEAKLAKYRANPDERGALAARVAGYERNRDDMSGQRGMAHAEEHAWGAGDAYQPRATSCPAKAPGVGLGAPPLVTRLSERSRARGLGAVGGGWLPWNGS